MENVFSDKTLIAGLFSEKNLKILLAKPQNMHEQPKVTRILKVLNQSEILEINIKIKVKRLRKTSIIDFISNRFQYKLFLLWFQIEFIFKND